MALPKFMPMLMTPLVLGAMACTPADPPNKCIGWNSMFFFKKASARVVAHCLREGADLNARDVDGWTPLHKAATSSETPAVIKTLLNAGADLNARDEIGRTPLHMAAFSKTPAVVKVLLDAGADLNARAEDGWTPLHFAAAFSKTPAVVKVLLDAGADPNARTKYGRTALDLIPDDSPLRDSDVYWQLNDVHYNRDPNSV